MFAEVEHPTADTFETLNAPFTMSASEVSVCGPARPIGRDTADVLRHFGIEDARIAQLAADGIVSA